MISSWGRSKTQLESLRRHRDPAVGSSITSRYVRLENDYTTSFQKLIIPYLTVRFIPSRLPLPGGNFKKLGMKYRDEVEGLRNVPHTWVKEQMVDFRLLLDYQIRLIIKN